MWRIKRVADSEYELQDPSGATVMTYSQTKMQHPQDWIRDAVDNGAEGWEIQAGDWEFIDERKQP